MPALTKPKRERVANLLENLRDGKPPEVRTRRKRSKPIPTPPAVLKSIRDTEEFKQDLTPEMMGFKDAQPALVQERKPQKKLPVRDYVNEAFMYAECLVNGKWERPVGELEIARARRFLLGIDKIGKKNYNWIFDEKQAHYACEWMEKAHHYKGKFGTSKFKMIAWQVLTVVELYGWRNKFDISEKRFDEVYIEVARGNGKTFFAALIGLYELLVVGGSAASVISAATTGAQAQYVMDAAKGIYKKGGECFDINFSIKTLEKELRATHNESDIIHKFETVNSNSKSLDGLGPVLSIVDELHAHQDSSLYDVLSSARGKVPNSMILSITTAGFDQACMAYETKRVGEQILRDNITGESSDRFYYVMHCLDLRQKRKKGKILKKADSPYNMKNVEKANPLFSFSSTLQSTVRSEMSKCKDDRSKIPNYETKRCNIWRHGHESWIMKEDLEDCMNIGIDWDYIVKNFSKIWVGADISSTTDLTSIALVGYKAEEDKLYTSCRNYIPKDKFKKRLKDEDVYHIFKDMDSLEVVEGDAIDYKHLMHDLKPVIESQKIRGILFDRYSIADKMTIDLTEELGDIVATLDWSAKFITPAAKEFEERVEKETMYYDGNNATTWMICNAVVERRVSGTLLPKKEHATSKKKIDALAATILAMTSWLTDEEGRVPEDDDDFYIGYG